MHGAIVDERKAPSIRRNLLESLSPSTTVGLEHGADELLDRCALVGRELAYKGCELDLVLFEIFEPSWREREQGPTAGGRWLVVERARILTGEDSLDAVAWPAERPGGAGEAAVFHPVADLAGALEDRPYGEADSAVRSLHSVGLAESEVEPSVTDVDGDALPRLVGSLNVRPRGHE